jgi:hypothetical protein
MSKDTIERRGVMLVAVSLLWSAAQCPALANEPAAATVQQVRVYPTYYAADGKRFANLDRLDDWVRSSGTRSLELHTCMWTANKQLTAAIERFQHVYLDVRWIEPGRSGCPAVARERMD